MAANITVDLCISLSHTLISDADKEIEDYIENLRNQIENGVVEYLAENADLIDYVEYNFEESRYKEK